MKKIIIFFLKIYKIVISPALVTLFGKACRYDISCSEYAIQAFNNNGLLKGGLLSAKRFLSCNFFIKDSKINELTN
jgi:hypothetical protein